MMAVQQLVNHLKSRVKAQIVECPEMSYVDIAVKTKVSLDFVQKQARELKRDTNFSRGFAWRKGRTN